MEELKKAIKESSIDCNLNMLETRDPEAPDEFECVISPRKEDENFFSYVPDILNDRDDADMKRGRLDYTWKGKPFVHRGTKYVARDTPDGKQLVYDYDLATKAIRNQTSPPKEIGEIIGSQLKLYKVKTKKKKKLKVMKKSSSKGSR